MFVFCFFFFFQAEDGIRDRDVTGVQTCALPISCAGGELGIAVDTRPRLLGINRNTVRKKVDRKSTRLNSSHITISYAVFCLKKKTRACAFSSASANCLPITAISYMTRGTPSPSD